VFLQDMIARARKAGHILEATYRTPDEYDFLEYCSCRAWNTGEQRVLVPKIGRTLTKNFVTVKKVENMLEHCVGIALGLAYYEWAPVTGKVVRQLVNARTSKSQVNKLDSDYQITLKSKLPFKVDNAVLAAQFERIYGMELSQVENEVNSIDFTLMGVEHVNTTIEALFRVDGIEANDVEMGSD